MIESNRIKFRAPNTVFFLLFTQGPEWIYSKFKFVNMLSFFGDECPQTGSKNVPPLPSDIPTKGLAWKVENVSGSKL